MLLTGISPAYPLVTNEPVFERSELSVITVGTLFVNTCPEFNTLSPFHCWIPHNVFAVSNQYVPSAGSASGATANGSSSPRSTSALTTKALFAIPKYE